MEQERRKEQAVRLFCFIQKALLALSFCPMIDMFLLFNFRLRRPKKHDLRVLASKCKDEELRGKKHHMKQRNQ
jgi:hypothetical protein